MKTLVIIETNIVSKQWVAEYLQHVPGLIQQFGGRYLGQSSQVECVENSGQAGSAPHFSAVLEFPSSRDFRAFYDSAAYAPYKQARMAGSQSRILLIPSA